MPTINTSVKGKEYPPYRGPSLVDLELWAENQKGEKVITGKATAALISRG